MSEIKLRILTVIDQYYPFMGGAENVARFLVEHTNNDEYENNVLTLATHRIITLINNSDLIQRQKVDSVCYPYNIFRFRLFTIKGQQKNGRIFRYFTLLKYIVHIFKLRNRFDIIHAHTYYWPATASVIAGRLLGKPVLITGHSRISRLVSEIDNGIYPGILIKSLKKANKYVAISHEIKSEAEHICNLDSNRIELLYNGIDAEQFRPCASNEMKRLIRVELDLPTDKTIVIYHGRMEKNKNILTLLNAMSRCKEQNIVLLLIGEGTYKKDIIDYIKKLDLSDYVSVFDFKKNIEEYLRASDIYCLPSYLEGFSLALLEGMSSGLICIASDIEGNRDAINHEVNGYLFDPYSDAQLEHLLKKTVLKINNNNRGKFGIAARDTVVERFSLAAMLESYKNLYHELARRPSL